MNFTSQIKEYTNAPLTRHLLLDILQDYKRPNDKISDLIKQGELISLRRGLYIPGTNSGLTIPNSFLIANHLRGPSYVSLEAALSYWGLIPERTYEMSSVTIKTSKKYLTPIGRYSYQHLPATYYSFGIQRVEMAQNQFALVASPEKALCDKIVLTTSINLRSAKQTRAFLHDDLRIDTTSLKELDIELISTWLETAPKASSLKMLISTIKEI